MAHSVEIKRIFSTAKRMPLSRIYSPLVPPRQAENAVFARKNPFPKAEEGLSLPIKDLRMDCNPIIEPNRQSMQTLCCSRTFYFHIV